MALVRSLNNDTEGGNDAMYQLLRFLQSLGWTLTRGGTGADLIQTYPPDSSYFGTLVGPGYQDADFQGWGVGDNAWWGGRIPPGVGTGANATRGSAPSLTALSFGRARCWYAVEDQNGRALFAGRSPTWGQADDDWVVAYSPDGWTNLPPAAYNAADPPRSPTNREIVLHGFSNGWTPGGFLPQWGGSANIKLHLIGDTDPEGPSGDRGFIMLAMQATNALAALIIFDPLVDALSGQDDNPHGLAVGAVANNALSPPNPFGSPSRIFTRWGGQAVASQIWTRCYYGWWSSTTTIEAPGNGRPSSYDSKERPLLVPISVEAFGAVPAVSKWLRWAGVSRDYPNKATSPDPWLYIDDMMVYGWDPAVTPQSI